MFWRIYLGKRMATSRRRLRSIIRRGSIHKFTTEPQIISRFRLFFNPKVLKFHLIKNFIPFIYTSACLIFAIATLYEYGYSPDCTRTVLRFRFEPLVLPLATTLTAAIAWQTRSFRDNFNVYLEIRRFVVVTVAMFGPTIILLIAYGQYPTLGIRVAVHQFLALVFQAQFFVIGFLPLRDQWRLERRILAEDFGALENFEKV